MPRKERTWVAHKCWFQVFVTWGGEITWAFVTSVHLSFRSYWIWKSALTLYTFASSSSFFFSFLVSLCHNVPTRLTSCTVALMKQEAPCFIGATVFNLDFAVYNSDESAQFDNAHFLLFLRDSMMCSSSPGSLQQIPDTSRAVRTQHLNFGVLVPVTVGVMTCFWSYKQQNVQVENICKLWGSPR